MDLDRVVAPPYDVLTAADVDRLAAHDLYNIVHVDVPLWGESRYHVAGKVLRRWIERGVLVADPQPSFTITRMTFVDDGGGSRHVTGVLGELEIADDGAGAVLRVEHTTRRACADRLDLMRHTQANTSPVWGLSLADGLTDLLRAPGEPVGRVTIGGVHHHLERITDPVRVAAISTHVAGARVLLADGHHRYEAARRHRDDIRASTHTRTGPAERTLAFVSELGADQFVVNPIHHLYRRECIPHLESQLRELFDIEPVGACDRELITEMVSRRRLALLDAHGHGSWLTPKPHVFDQVRDLDSSRLEQLERGCMAHKVFCQQGVGQVRQTLADGGAEAVILTRPASLADVTRSGCEGVLMPPWTTSFAPKPLTGIVIRDLAMA